MSNTDIEKRLSDLMEQIKNDIRKEYDDKLENKIKEGQEKVINNLFNMFPHLEMQKNEIIEECIANPKKEHVEKKMRKREVMEEMVFDKISYKGYNYYLDENNGIWNQKAELVGSLIDSNEKGYPMISFFEENQNLSEDIFKLLE